MSMTMKLSNPKKSLSVLLVPAIAIGGLILLYELLQNAIAGSIGYWPSCLASMALNATIAAAVGWGVLREKQGKNEAVQKLVQLSVEHQQMGEQLYEALDLNAKIISDAP